MSTRSAARCWHAHHTVGAHERARLPAEPLGVGAAQPAGGGST